MFRFKTLQELIDEDIRPEPGFHAIAGVAIQSNTLVQSIMSPSSVVRIRINRIGTEVPISSLAITDAPLPGRVRERWFKKSSNFVIRSHLSNITIWVMTK